MSRVDLEVIYQGVGFFQDTLGPEFSYEVPSGAMSGFLTEDEQTVVALHAGLTCFFR